MSYAPFVRIGLRYVVGGVFIGSDEVGQALAADPDLVAAGAVIVGALVEASYALAKRKGWFT